MENLSVKAALEGLQKSLVANQDYKIDYFDVKYLNEEEHKLRLEVKRMITLYRSWLETLEKQRDVRVLVFANMKAESMKANMTETLSLYRKIKMLRNFYTEIYLRQLPNR